MPIPWLPAAGGGRISGGDAMTAQTPDIEQLLADEHARRQPPKRLPPLAAMTREFQAFGEDRYRMVVAEIGVTLEVDRLRREHHELMGELSAHCELPGARTVDGSLSIAGLNLSSAMARQYRAKLLSDRANTPGFDWAGLIEEFCQRVLQADRAGQPAVDLRQIERPNPKEDMIEVDGLALPKHHPSILFGDGGTGKSYLALYLAGRMAEKGVSVMLADWELCGDDHRDRLERLFPDGMPRILYARCEKPLVFEADRLRRVVKENGIQFSVFDSIAFASDGPPEAAEVAGRYFRAVRQIGGGSLHVAHVTKGENADKKPFGSAFWSNGARATWYVKQDEASAGSDALQIGLFNRKANLGRLRPAVGFAIEFTDECTRFRRTDVADTPELAGQLTVFQRMQHLLRSRSMTVTQIAEELNVEVNTVTQTVNRYVKKGRVFIVLDGQNTNRRIGLLERDSCHDSFPKCHDMTHPPSKEGVMASVTSRKEAELR